MDLAYLVFLLVFQLMIGLLGLLDRKNKVLCLFPIFASVIGIFTLFTLLQDGNINSAYNGATPINWSDNPGWYVPLTLTLGQWVLGLLQAFGRLR